MSSILHIIKLTLSNCGIIRAAAILPDGSPVILAGDNGQGKSTVLNSIESVLFAKKLAEPISHDQDKAHIQLELGEPGTTKPLYRVEQIIKKDKDGKPCYNLKVIDAEGKQVGSPATFIENLIASGAALDPIGIMQPRPGEKPETFAKRQAETLMERLGLTEKAKTLDDQIAAKELARKTAKAEAEDLETRASAISVPKDTPDELLEVGDLASKIAEYNDLKLRRERLADRIETRDKTAETTMKALNDARKALAGAEKAWNEAKQALNNERTVLEEFDTINPPDAIQKSLADTQAKMENISQVNANVAKKLEWKDLSRKQVTAQTNATTLTSELEKLRKERLQIVRDAKLPVEGLELTAEALLYKGKPLIQESTGNMIRVCALLAMSENPDCRILFIREGALTNSRNKKIIFDLAKERGYQVWIEEFSEEPIDGALWIEGGEVTEPVAK